MARALRLFAFALGLGFAAWAAAQGFGPAVAPRTTSMAFEAPAGGPLAFRGAVAVSPPDGDFGGLSGAIFETPDTILAISDRARWARIRLEIEDGRLTGVAEIETTPLLDAAGAPAKGAAWDAEGLTRGADGRLRVSFERDHRIGAWAAPDAPAAEELRHPAWELFSNNSGLEALATAPDGRLWAIRERSGDLARPFPVFIGDARGWEEKRLPRRGPYLPTGADFDADGRLYVAERAFSFIGGFRFRLRRLTWGAEPDPVTEETLLELPAQSNIDNIEAVALRTEGAQTWLLILSDDNFLPVQRNVIALFEVLR